MNTRIIVLAGGRGKRMQSELAKVLTLLKDKPIIKHLLEAVDASEIDPRPVVVVGWGAEEVKRELGSRYEYVFQEVQLGTGHAVRCAEPALKGKSDAVIVLYGDQPFVRSSMIVKLRDIHEREGKVLTMMTAHVDDFEDWRVPFFDFGRVVRDARGAIARIVEKKDATPDELEIREVNPSFICFDAGWLWSRLGKLTNRNVPREYYLPDLVRIAIDEGEEIASIDINPLESIGVNTPEHLKLVTTLTASSLLEI